jgi:hypothetical protein
MDILSYAFIIPQGDTLCLILGVPAHFCPPANFGGVPAAPAARQPVSFVQNRFGFGSINALDNLDKKIKKN